jgi:L-asparaginase II
VVTALAQQVRSGVVETVHDGAVAVVAVDGTLVASFGDIDTPFFLRSAAKPFQATVSQESGAALTSLEMSLACASHRGFPAQIALVSSILEQAGLDESSLGCPHDWPLAPVASRIVVRAGAVEPRRIWHNCSGKHSGFLRACVANGWPVETYLSPDHPLQRRVIAFLGEVGGYDVEPVGVDGCGAPVLRTTVRAMALMFARLGSESRLAEAFEAMHRYPSLVSANTEGDTEIAIANNAAAKGGAAGCVGVALASRLGVAVKSWDGLGKVANIGAVSALDQLDVLTPTARSTLEPLLRPVVRGGGRPVGHFESRMRLNFE